jgi:hypothetical protein
MSSSKIASLGSVTGRDEFIIGEALATALIALAASRGAPADAQYDGYENATEQPLCTAGGSLHLITARGRFIPSAQPLGARNVERG